MLYGRRPRFTEEARALVSEVELRRRLLWEPSTAMQRHCVIASPRNSTSTAAVPRGRAIYAGTHARQSCTLVRYLGRTPFYVRQWRQNGSFRSNFLRLFALPAAPSSESPFSVLSTVIEDSATPFRILQSVANGVTRCSAIRSKDNVVVLDAPENVTRLLIDQHGIYQSLQKYLARHERTDSRPVSVNCNCVNATHEPGSGMPISMPRFPTWMMPLDPASQIAPLNSPDHGIRSGVAFRRQRRHPATPELPIIRARSADSSGGRNRRFLCGCGDFTGGRKVDSGTLPAEATARNYVEVSQTPYCIASQYVDEARRIASRVRGLRASGSLDPQALKEIYRFFRIRNIYNSNAIEGNTLDIGETRLVVEQGLTLTGKPLRDQAEAKNLSAALDLLEDLATSQERPITESDVRQLHAVVLRDVNDENAGKYRTVSVEISGSQHKPPSPVDVPQEMEVFGKWLSAVSVPGDDFLSDNGLTYALVAHTWFVMVHPFIDGNGRVARLLLNLLLMRYGFPIAIITREDRLRYYAALEDAQSSDLTAFGELVIECEQESIEEYEKAVRNQQQRRDWARELAARFSNEGLIRVKNSYEVWKSAMELLRSYFKQTAELLNDETPLGHVYFNDFGMLDFEKYLTLMQGESAKKTWFFRIDFVQGSPGNQARNARYLFFFGSPSPQLRDRQCEVTILAAREDPPGSFNYTRLEHITASNVPDLVELGYESKGEQFVQRTRSGGIATGKLEDIGRQFIEQVISKHFSA